MPGSPSRGAPLPGASGSRSSSRAPAAQPDPNRARVLPDGTVSVEVTSNDGCAEHLLAERRTAVLVPQAGAVVTVEGFMAPGPGSLLRMGVRAWANTSAPSAWLYARTTSPPEAAPAPAGNPAPGARPPGAAPAPCSGGRRRGRVRMDLPLAALGRPHDDPVLRAGSGRHRAAGARRRRGAPVHRGNRPDRPGRARPPAPTRASGTRCPTVPSWSPPGATTGRRAPSTRRSRRSGPPWRERPATERSCCAGASTARPWGPWANRSPSSPTWTSTLSSPVPTS